MLTVAATGHRPDKLGGYGGDVHERLVRFAAVQLASLSPDTVLSGMALGWDQAIAEAALQHEIRLVCAVPFEGQEERWPEKSQRRYRDLLAKAAVVEILSGRPYAAFKMQDRNEWMVNRCDTVLALWNGSDGGTANCLRYARSLGRPIVNAWPAWERRC